MATTIEKANWIAEESGGILEMFAAPEDVKSFIEGAPLDDEIWKKRADACAEILEDFTPCLFDTIECVVAARIYEDEFYYDGKAYSAD